MGSIVLFILLVLSFFFLNCCLLLFIGFPYFAFPFLLLCLIPKNYGLLLVGGNSVICGDFNYWVDDPSSKPFSAEFGELLDLSNFENFVSFPTHLSGHTLNLILVPAGSEYVKHVEALPIYSDMSDHALILFSLEVMRPHAVRKTITFRSYSNVDNNSIVNDIEHVLNVLDVSSLTAEDCTIWYNNFFNSLENKFCPLISKEILVKADAPWCDHTVAVLRRTAERGWRRFRSDTLTLMVYLPPSYQGHCPCSVLYLFLHFVLLVYNFLVHIIGFSK